MHIHMGKETSRTELALDGSLITSKHLVPQTHTSKRGSGLSIFGKFIQLNRKVP